MQAFDELHLLRRGGRTIYAKPTGTESAELISYFEATSCIALIASMLLNQGDLEAIQALRAHFCMQAFDELHLLKRGGKTIYAGPTGTESAELISYFETVPGVPPVQPGMNPATWMLGE